MSNYTPWPGDEDDERISYARSTGWQPVSSWGLNGWDLGNWPYVIVHHRGETALALDVEGDITIESFTTAGERDRRTDELAFFYWKNANEQWVQGIDSHQQMPDHLRGAFSWPRHENEKATQPTSCRR